MLAFLKNALQRQTADSSAAPLAASALWCGLHDASINGWGHAQSRELFKGFATTAEEQVLDVRYSEGIATLFAAQGASVIFAGTEANKVELVSSGKPGAQYLVRVPAPVDEYLQEDITPPRYFATPNHFRIFSHDDFTRRATDTGLIIEYLQAIRFFWVMCMVFFWASVRAARQGSKVAVRDHIAQRHNPRMDNWAGVWRRLLDRPDGLVIKQQLDRFMPKSQMLIARKARQDQR